MVHLTKCCSTVCVLLLLFDHVRQAPVENIKEFNGEKFDTIETKGAEIKNLAFYNAKTSSTQKSAISTSSSNDRTGKTSKKKKIFVVARVYSSDLLEKYDKSEIHKSVHSNKYKHETGSLSGPGILDFLNEIGGENERDTFNNKTNEIPLTELPSTKQPTRLETESGSTEGTTNFISKETPSSASKTNTFELETTPFTRESEHETVLSIFDLKTTPFHLETTPYTATDTDLETTLHTKDMLSSSTETTTETTPETSKESEEITTAETESKTTPYTKHSSPTDGTGQLNSTTASTSPTSRTVTLSQTPTGNECDCRKESKQISNPHDTKWGQFKPEFTSTTDDQKHYELAEYISQHIFKHYPEYRIPLLAKYLSKNTQQRAYDGMVMEFQQPNNFNILVTDSYSQFNNAGRNGHYGGRSQTAEQYPSLYQCTKAIRYCSINPKYCQYQEGDYDTNIILVVPHSGSVKPETIKERSSGCLINGQCVYLHNCGIPDSVRCPVYTQPDRNSKTLAFNVASHLKNLSGTRPHIVVMDLHRSLVDADGSRDEGAFDDVTRSAWYDFHNFISLAKLKIQGNGLLIDLHEHKYRHGLVELSYGIKTSELSQNTHKLSESSVRSLASRLQDVTHSDLLKGPRSLGGKLEKRHIETVPSPNNPDITVTGNTDRQMITKLYGSMYGGNVDAIRVSVPRKYQMEQASMFGKILAESIHDFVKYNYSNEIGKDQ